MDMETWFAPAIEMGRLVRQYRIAQEDEKEELERRIQNSAYISRLNTMQSFNSVDFLRGIVEEDAVQAVLVLYSYVYYNRDYTKPLSGAPTNSGCSSSRKAALPTPAEPKPPPAGAAS